MRDPKRINTILTQLQEVWEKVPDLRLGQLLLNVVVDPALYYLEDQELISRLKSYYQEEDVSE